MQWDAHDDIDANHEKMCGMTDKPVAALLTDLKRTGLLDDTLVVWGGEFGRTPVRQGGGRGRDHNATGFTMWMAGGGVKGGTIVGATDEAGLKAIEDPRPRQRHPRHDPAPDGPRPQAAHVPAQRPRRAAHRRRRPCDQEAAGVSAGPSRFSSGHVGRSLISAPAEANGPKCQPTRTRRRSETSGASTPPSPAAIKSGRHCPTIRTGSS